MYSLFKKEITSFFGSLAGYVVVIVYLLATSLFLWVFPGNFNIPDNGYASLGGLFELAPWVYLFLVPAVTMRLFAEEHRLGTIEILLTRPLSSMQIVWGKYLAGLTLVIISLVPTLIYFYSVYALGSPVGNLDTGGTWGSFIGLFSLSAIYVAIGVFASALTDNQIFSFILAIALSFLAYMGFDFVGSVLSPSDFQQFIIWLGINDHYLSVSRGVVDSRDLLYFVAAVLLFLFLTSIWLRPGLWWKSLFSKRAAWIAGVFALLFWISAAKYFRIDLTAEKRYSLSQVSEEVAKRLEKNVQITLYLDGDLPPGFKKLQSAIVEKVADYNAYSSKRIHIDLADPYEITNEKEREKLFSDLVKMGLQPTEIRQNTEQGINTKLIFPGAIVSYGDKHRGVNLLKNNQSLGAEENLNNSVETIEFELTSVLVKLMAAEKPAIAFMTGHGELNEYETRDITLTLSDQFEVNRITSEALVRTPDKYRAVVIASPTQVFPEADKLAIDQYLMRGGRVMWLVDPVQVSLDSLSNGYSTLAFGRDLKLDDQLFRYGVRLNYDLVQDVNCLMLPVNTAPVGSPAKFTPAPWYYSPLLTPSDNSVISRNLNLVKAEFASTIDTVGNSGDVKKTVILTTSAYSRKIQTPLEVSLSSINQVPDRRLFNQPSQIIGVLLEGKFTSVFKNRMVSGVAETESKPTKMIVVSDGNLIANQYRHENGQLEYLPMGYDRFSKQTFGNKDFISNAIHYLCDDSGIMELRSRVFKIRILDKVKVREEKLGWQLFNVLSPVALVILGGVVFVFFRKRRYSR